MGLPNPDIRVRLAQFDTHASAGGGAPVFLTYAGANPDMCGQFPKGFVTFVSGQSAAVPGAESGGARFSFGAQHLDISGVAPSKHCIEIGSSNGQGVTKEHHEFRLNELIAMPSATNTSYFGFQTDIFGLFDAFAEDINAEYLDGDGVSTFRGFNISFGGADVSTSEFRQTMNGATTINVGGVVRPDLVILFSANIDFGDTTTSNFSIGFATSDGTQYCISQAELFNVVGGNPSQTIRSDCALTCQNNGAATLDYKLHLQNFGANSFDIAVSAGNARSDKVGIMVVQFDSPARVKLFNFTTPLAGGDVAYGGIGFKPAFGFMLASSLQALNVSLHNDALAGGLSINAFSEHLGAKHQWAGEFRVKQGANPTNTGSRLANKALSIPSDTASGVVQATLASMDADGFTLNYSAVAGAAKEVVGFVIEQTNQACEAIIPLVGGTTWLLDSDGEQERAVVALPAMKAIDATLEIGPFRLSEQKQADEMSRINTLTLGLSENGAVPVEFVDLLTSTDPDEDFLAINPDSYEDWNEGNGDGDNFALELWATDDGMRPNFNGQELLPVVEDLGSAFTYAPEGKAAVFHRLKLYATDPGQKFSVKFVDIAGALAGRRR